MVKSSVSENGDCTVFHNPHPELIRKAPFDPDYDLNKDMIRAKKMLDQLNSEYYKRARKDIKNLQGTFSNLVTNLNEYPSKLKDFIEVANDMREQGANYDYHMVSYVGDYLCRLSKRIKACPTKTILDLMKIHINAMDTLLFYRIKGRSDERGDQIINGIESALQKFAPDIVRIIHDFRKREEKRDTIKTRKVNYM